MRLCCGLLQIDAIFRHESQKDWALFPGADPREFWQRARDRNEVYNFPPSVAPFPGTNTQCDMLHEAKVCSLFLGILPLCVPFLSFQSGVKSGTLRSCVHFISSVRVLQATAALYNLLGLPEYQAMELFIEYCP